VNRQRRTSKLEMIELTGAGARFLIWSFFVTIAVLAVWTLGENRYPVLVCIGVLLFAGACLAVTIDRGDRLSLAATTYIMVVGVGSCFLSWQLISLGYPQWFIGSMTVSFFYVSLRGRMILAWVGFTLASAVIMVWSLTTDFGFASGLLSFSRHLPIMIVGTLFAAGLRRSGDDIRRLAAESTARAAAEAALVATAREREDRLVALGEFATSLLERLATGEAPTPAHRQEYALAEAELRDSVRAPSLALPDVTAAARSARRRGVEVVLLDDSEPSSLGASALARASSRIAALLNATKDGRLTARLLPPGRDVIATIVVDGTRNLSEDVPA
jgi:hypothetical protein